MNRRAVLLSAGGLLLSQFLTACQTQNRPSLKVKFLKTSIPPQLLQEFQRTLQQSAILDFDTEEKLSDLFQQLKDWAEATTESAESSTSERPFLNWRRRSRSQPAVDLMTLGDYWLTPAIRNQWIQPLDPSQLQQWSQLPLAWRALVTRNAEGLPDPSGQVWGAPYRWGSTVIAYRVDAFEELGWVPQDWADLWRPELTDKISLLNHPREVIGLTLKKLGYSYNTTDLEAVPNLFEELRSLHQQVKFYSSDSYLQPLLIGDTWAAVGWSTDLRPILEQNREIAVVVPQSGTALSSDVWVRPATKAAPVSDGFDLAAQWIDFCWQLPIAKQLSILSPGTSPIVVEAQQTLDAALQAEPLILPDPEVLARSEFLLPLPEAVAKAQWRLWVELRQRD